MGTVENILVIDWLSIEPESDGRMMRFKSRLEAEINTYCPITGNCFSTLKIIAENKGYSKNEALKNVIQDFINKDFETEVRMHNVDISPECTPSSKINRIDIQIGEPFKSLFESLFDASSWETPKHQLS